MAEHTLAEAGRFLLEARKARIARAVKAVQETVATRGLQLVQEAINTSTPPPEDRGTYRRGWRVKKLPNGSELYNLVPYSGVIEHGRRPGAAQPPTEPLMRWAKRKGLVTGRGRSADANARSVAFAIARAIAKRGIKGRHVLYRAAKRLRKEVRLAVKRAMAATE